MSPGRIGAMLVKELRHILRDPRSLIMALVLPLFLMMLFGYALNLDLDRIPTMIQDGSHSPQSRDLVQAFQGSRFFEVTRVADPNEIERAIFRDRVLLGIIIPPDYSRLLATASRTPIQVVVDGSDSNTASIALGYAENVLQTYSFQLRTVVEKQRAGFTPAVPVEARTRIWYNETLESKNFVVPGLIAVILMVISTLPTSLTIARELEMGTLETLQSTSLRPAEMILGKMGAYFVVGVIDTALSVLVAIVVFHVPFRGNMYLLAATGCVFLCGAMFWGLLLSSVATSQFMAFQMGMVSSFLPAFLLSGFIYLIENMPRAIQVITWMIPARYFVTLMRAFFEKGVGVKVLWPEMIFLLAFSSIVFVLATLAMRRRLG